MRTTSEFLAQPSRAASRDASRSRPRPGRGGRRRLPAIAALGALALGLAALGGPAAAQRQERAGKDVVDAVCASCHVPGSDGAPRIGDAKAWAQRASLGLTALTDHAIKGIRNMPAHGGNAGVSDIEIERAITYMVNRSGGHWVEPVGGATPAVLRGSEQVVQAQCAKCHEAGLEGAPKIGDRPAWTPRLQKGLDALVRSAVHGHGGMPARGGMPDLSDAEIRGAIVYMFNVGIPAAAPQPAPAPDSPFHRRVAGTDVYLGLVPAKTLREAQAAGRPVGAAKGGIPKGNDVYHVNISLADAARNVPVTDAEVKVKVSDWEGAQTRRLELVAENNTVSYGGYFRLVGGRAYTITAEIRRPGVPTAGEARFDYKAR